MYVPHNVHAASSLQISRLNIKLIFLLRSVNNSFTLPVSLFHNFVVCYMATFLT